MAAVAGKGGVDGCQEARMPSLQDASQFLMEATEALLCFFFLI